LALAPSCDSTGSCFVAIGSGRGNGIVALQGFPFGFDTDVGVAFGQVLPEEFICFHLQERSALSISAYALPEIRNFVAIFKAIS
jgi:hypothetical protein